MGPALLSAGSASKTITTPHAFKPPLIFASMFTLHLGILGHRPHQTNQRLSRQQADTAAPIFG
jgi:hypothetical protein